MEMSDNAEWLPNLSSSTRPHYVALADQIALDVRTGRLNNGDKLPSQRKLAATLSIDFTTVARGYSEARKRGLVDARVGYGTFITATTPPIRVRSDAVPRRIETVDMTMNLPPETDDPVLISRMQAGLQEISRDLVSLLRYQSFGGSPADKDAAASWLGRRALVPAQSRIFISPGAHPALLAIFGILAKPGETLLCEAITYPGARSIAAQLGVSLAGLRMDRDGIDPAALIDACKNLAPKGLYLNPTLHNPTTHTVPEARRSAIAAICRRYQVPIIEDDAYGFIPQHGPVPFAALAPDITWHIAGLAKCIGAGLRAAYIVVPDIRSSWPFAAALRAATVMASPLTLALTTRWIEDGTADAILQFTRGETAARQTMAAEILPKGSFQADPLSFNLWVPLPEGWTRSAFISHMRTTGIGAVASDAFTVTGTPPEAVRICLGGPSTRDHIRHALEYIAHTLTESPSVASVDL